MENIKFISHYMKGHRYKILIMVVMMLGAVGLRLVSPLLLQFIIDNVINDVPITSPMWQRFSDFFGGVAYIKENLWINAVVLVGVSVVSGIMVFIRSYANGSYSEAFSKNLRDHLYDHLQKLPYAYHVKSKTGDLIQRCTSDVDQIYRFLSSQILELVFAVYMIGFALFVMLQTDVTMTMYSIVVFPFISVFAYIFFKKMQSAFQESDEAEAVLSTIFQESLDGVRVVKAFNRERYELDRFESKNAIYRDKTIRMMRLLAIYWSVSDILCFVQILFVLLMATFNVRSGNISTGNAVVFVSYISMILWPVRNVGRILSDMGKVTVSIKRLKEILDEPEEDLDTGVQPSISGSIEFQDVMFKYDDSSQVILKGISFKVNAGETLAIMGPTGSGKSSLIHLLTRLYEPTQGCILLDGVPLNTISRRHVREAVGLVLQEPFLFSKTIYDNIRLSKPESKDSDIYRAASVASIHSDILSFDRGYQTLVGEKGVTLSGGQRQRVAISRALIKEQPILIFDDSLSALDTQTDAKIRRELKALHHQATTIIVTHRINTAMDADKIIMIQNGRIIQEGTHEMLLREEGLYKRIAQIQSQTGGEHV